MDPKVEMKIKLRSKKLGLLLYDSRLYARRTPQECAGVLGLSEEQYLSIEEGKRAPSLPELEILSYYLNIPINHFWGNESLTEKNKDELKIDLKRLQSLRNRIISTRLRQVRLQANLTIPQLVEKTSLTEERINQIESGADPISLPELEILCEGMNINVETLFDQKGPFGEWHSVKETFGKFNELPADVQEFISKPVNIPFIKVAIRLSELSANKLRAVAEGLLEITY
jgi:transcriptional regulator with XRE-family HTH domain